MVTLIIGGAASGKSAYAEELAMQSPGVPRLYVATMLAQDAESRARVKRHRALRRGKGFFTVECPLALEKLFVPTGAAVLLECLSNLLANECYCPEGAGEHAEASILRGMDRLFTTAADVIVVSNAIFSDGIQYDSSTQGYLAQLGCLNEALANRADRVVEVVCGIPIVQKGRGASCV